MFFSVPPSSIGTSSQNKKVSPNNIAISPVIFAFLGDLINSKKIDEKRRGFANQTIPFKLGTNTHPKSNPIIPDPPELPPSTSTKYIVSNKEIMKIIKVIIIKK